MGSEIIISFITLSLLEIVLGIDNLIFIALVADNLPPHHRNKARLIGLSLALGIRVVMLASLSWVMQLTEPLITIEDLELSFRDLLLLAGGVFLIGKSTMEMHADIAVKTDGHKRELSAAGSLTGAIFQIAVIDFVFSFDSVMTAVGIASDLRVMVAAVVVSMVVMLIASGYISKFLNDYPTFKILALSFILMIGMVLVAEGMHVHIPKQYIYFAFAFSLFVEGLNSLASKKRRSLAKKRRPEGD